MNSRKRGATAGLSDPKKRTKIDQPPAVSYPVAPSAPSSTDPALHLQSRQPPTPEYSESQPCDLVPTSNTQEWKFPECIEEAISYQTKSSELWRVCVQQLLFRIQALEDLKTEQNLVIASQGRMIEGLQASKRNQEQILATLRKEIADLNGKHEGLSEFLHAFMDRLKTVSISDLFKGFLSR